MPGSFFLAGHHWSRAISIIIGGIVEVCSWGYPIPTFPTHSFHNAAKINKYSTCAPPPDLSRESSGFDALLCQKLWKLFGCEITTEIVFNIAWGSEVTLLHNFWFVKYIFQKLHATSITRNNILTKSGFSLAWLALYKRYRFSRVRINLCLKLNLTAWQSGGYHDLRPSSKLKMRNLGISRTIETYRKNISVISLAVLIKIAALYQILVGFEKILLFRTNFGI